MDLSASLINAMQRQILEIMDKMTKQEATLNLMEEVNVQLYNTVMGQAEKIVQLQSQVGKRRQN